MLVNQNNSIEKVIRGINHGADIITSTFGGSGKNVLIFKDGHLTFTKDGVSVAREIGFTDIQENMGAKLLISAASMTVKECGDGTTLTSLLVKEFVEKLFNEINNGAEVNDLLDSTRLLIAGVASYLKLQAKQIENTQDVYNIAFTSCKNARLASLIQNIYKKAGLDANITLNKSKDHKVTYVEHIEGLTFHEGMINDYFSNQDNGTCVFEKPQFLIDDDFINEVSEIRDIIDEYHIKKTPLVIIAKGFSQMVMNYCVSNKVQTGLQICLIKLPGFGTQQVRENLADMRIFLNNFTANSVYISKESFTIHNSPNKTSLRKRLTTLRSRVESATEEYDIQEYQNRIANLQQKSAIIHVGGITQKNLDEEYDRIEDAIGAVRSTTILGYVPGTGSILFKYAFETSIPGWFQELLIEPQCKILRNANINFSINVDYKSEPYNVRTRQIDHSLVDPVYVLITALENSFALAELLINTSYVMHD